METHMHVKTDTRVLVCKHTVPLMEERTLLCRREEWQENRGDTLRQSSAYTGNCWDTQVTSVSMFIDPTLIQRQAHSRKLTSFNQVVVICANQSFGEDGKSLDWLTYNEGLVFFLVSSPPSLFFINAVWEDASGRNPTPSNTPKEITCMNSVHAYASHTLIEG